MDREKYIIKQLEAVAFGTRDSRVRAVARLNAEGFPDTEITAALRAETVRLNKQTANLNAATERFSRKPTS